MDHEFKLSKKRFISKDNDGGQAMYAVLRIGAWLIGAAGSIMGILVCLTLIGIPFGLLMLNGSKEFFDFAAGKRRAECPNCKKINFVHVEQERFTCRKCSEKVRIEWIENDKDDKTDEKPNAM